MQTFLPLPDLRASAAALDPDRLGNQFYREGLTLLRGKWPNHPASRMWRGHGVWLARYLLACAIELRKRGRAYPAHEDEVLARLEDFRRAGEADPPPWFGLPAFHAAHRSQLLLKRPDWYGRFGWADPPGLPYLWPDGVAAPPKSGKSAARG